MLTIVEAAERIGVSASTIRNQIKNGVIHARQSGKIYLVRVSEIERYRRENKGRVGPKPKERSVT